MVALTLFFVAAGMLLATPGAAEECAADLSQYVFNSPGGVPAEAAQGITPWGPFFIALADMAYDQDFGLGSLSPRKSIGPCLGAWGAQGNVLHLSATTPRGGDIHAYVFRSKHDIFVAFRGLADRRDITAIEADTNPFDVIVNGRQRPMQGATPGHHAYLLNITESEAGGLPEEFWVLQGYAEAALALGPQLEKEIAKMIAQLPADYKIFVTGHSDGSQYAQLLGIRLAAYLGVERVGGVFLIGPGRVGSAGFAETYNKLIGNVTLRFKYGRDPASEEINPMSQGLRFPGKGFTACPVQGYPVEALVIDPIGKDEMNTCKNMQAPGWVGRAGALIAKLGNQLGLAASRTNLAIDALDTMEYLPNHLPNMAFDAWMRQMAAQKIQMPPCMQAALQLPVCVVSSKCDTALRPQQSPQCNSCGTDATCQLFYGQAGASCDSRSSMISGWLCYKGFKPPTLLGLLTMPNWLNLGKK